MAEFAIFPVHRRQHLAQNVVSLIFSQYPGQWEIKYHEKILQLKNYGRKRPYNINPQKTHLNKLDKHTIPKIIVIGTPKAN